MRKHTADDTIKVKEFVLLSLILSLFLTHSRIVQCFVYVIVHPGANDSLVLYTVPGNFSDLLSYSLTAEVSHCI